MLDQARMAARYLRDLPGFLRTPLDSEECRSRIEAGLANRDRSFLLLVERGVFGRPTSPYRRLFAHFGVEQGDVSALVRDEGVEGALARLYDAGITISLDELKGGRPLVRPGLEVELDEDSFNNPFQQPHFEALGGGSSSGIRRATPVDLRRLEQSACYHRLYLEAFKLVDRPVTMWYPAPPGVAGMINMLQFAKLGMKIDRWFSQTTTNAVSTRYALFTRLTAAISRVGAVRIPMPEHVPHAEAETVARWLAQRKEAGVPSLLRATSSSAVRVARAAAKAGIDISGTMVRTGGEPLTPAKAEAIQAAGCPVACSYAMSEAGNVGFACADGTLVDDVHVTMPNVAVLQRPRKLDSGDTVQALYHTTLGRGGSKLMLNAESGDSGILERRQCSCPATGLGLDLHLHTIRSYERLATEGMNFLSSTVADLVEVVLPERFGGGPGDYQFIEQERDGLTRVTIAVSPRLEGIDEGRVVDAVLTHLGRHGGPDAMMAEVWRSAGTLKVARQEPYVSDASKTPHLHTLRA
jgi:hypothetical protein